MEERNPYNDGYTHEALHTAHVLLETWGQHVSDSRCAEEFPDVAVACEAAIAAMYNVYQIIGQKFKDEQREPGSPVVTIAPE